MDGMCIIEEPLLIRSTGLRRVVLYDEWGTLQKDGHDAYRLRSHTEWYDRRWNRDPTYTPAASELEWYHYDEPPIIAVTTFDDTTRAVTDGRLETIIREHTPYMEENDREIGALDVEFMFKYMFKRTSSTEMPWRRP